jgi:hypothetical protein
MSVPPALQTAVAVAALHVALDGLARHKARQRRGRDVAAGPLPTAALAHLLALGCIHAEQSDPLACDIQGVAVERSGGAGYGAGCGPVGERHRHEPAYGVADFVAEAKG